MGATVTRPWATSGCEGLRTTMLTLLAAVAFVLLIACVNVANLLLARGAGGRRSSPSGERSGAAGSRIARQLLTESILLALAGGAAGLLLAAVEHAGLVLCFQAGNSLNLPLRPIDSIPMDGRVFAFALLVSCVTGVLFGVAPAIERVAHRRERAPQGRRAQRQAAGGKPPASRAGGVARWLLAMVVLSGAGLMIKSMTRLLGVDPGLNPKNVLTMEMSVPQEEIYVGPPGLPRFCQDLDEHVGAIPGVVSVGAVAHLPFRGNAGRSFQIEGQPPAAPGHLPGASYTVACPNYFRTMGIPVLKGREFTPRKIR